MPQEERGRELSTMERRKPKEEEAKRERRSRLRLSDLHRLAEDVVDKHVDAKPRSHERRKKSHGTAHTDEREK
jgi:hypothetical protein